MNYLGVWYLDGDKVARLGLLGFVVLFVVDSASGSVLLMMRDDREGKAGWQKTETQAILGSWRRDKNFRFLCVRAGTSLSAPGFHSGCGLCWIEMMPGVKVQQTNCLHN